MQKFCRNSPLYSIFHSDHSFSGSATRMPFFRLLQPTWHLVLSIRRKYHHRLLLQLIRLQMQVQEHLGPILHLVGRRKDLLNIVETLWVRPQLHGIDKAHNGKVLPRIYLERLHLGQTKIQGCKTNLWSKYKNNTYAC